MRKSVLCLMVITLLIVLTACRVTVEKQFCPVVTELPERTDEVL